MQLLCVLTSTCWAPIAANGPMADRSRPAALEKVGVQNGVSLHDAGKGVATGGVAIPNATATARSTTRLPTGTANQPPSPHVAILNATAEAASIHKPARSCLGSVQLITSWQERTGVQLLSIVNAVQTAMCCAAQVQLRRHIPLIRENACLDFRGMTRIAPKQCEDLSTTSMNHFYSARLRRHCRGTTNYREKAWQTVQRLIVDRTLPCANATVVHVRGGDVFDPLKTHGSYAQPPLAYYVRAIAHAHSDRAVRLVSEDTKNPVLTALKSRDRNIIFETRSFDVDLTDLLTASRVVMSSTTLTGLVSMSKCLETLYVPKYARGSKKSPSPFCKAAVWSYNSTRWKVRWSASAAQMHDLLEMDRGTDVGFLRVLDNAKSANNI